MLRKFVTYSASLYGAAVLTAAVGILLRSLIAKTLGKEALGIYTYLFTLVALGGALLAFGLGRTLAKHVAERPDGKGGEIVGGILALVVVISVFLATAGLLIWKYIDPVYALALIAVGPYTVFELSRAILRGQMQHNREPLAAVVAAVIRLALVWLCASVIGSIWSPTLGLTAAYLVTALLALLYFLWRDPSWWRPRRLIRGYASPGFWALLGLAAPLWVADLVTIINNQADRLIIQGQLGFAVLGEYAAAMTVVFFIAQPITVMSRMYLVTFARGFYAGIEEYRRLVSLNLAFVPCLALGVAALSELLTHVFFTTEYTLVPSLVAVLSIAFVPKSAEVLNSALTIAQDYPQANRNAKLLTAAIYLPATFFLVRTYGVMGAAWSYVLGWGSYALIHMAFMGRCLPEHSVYTFRRVLAGLVLYIVILGVMQISSAGLLSVLFAPLYLAAGHVLHIWDLGDALAIARKLVRSYRTGGRALEFGP